MEIVDQTTERLARAGCIAAAEEAAELLEAAAGDVAQLDALVARRCDGEPLAWLVGATEFCGLRIRVAPGVYVPRWQSEPLAERAAEHLPADGRAIDLATGSGAIAAVLRARRPGAEVLGIDIDPLACACARENGIEVREGDLLDAAPSAWRGSVDVLVGVLPYVPTPELAYLPRDVREHEPVRALDGGDDGLAHVARTIRDAACWLRPGGWLLLEVGGDQPRMLESVLEAAGFVELDVLRDDDGDARAVIARREESAAAG